MREKPESLHRDTKVLTLLALRVTKAYLIAMKEEYDVPQGRLLDQAVEELALRLLGKKKVERIRKAMRDPLKRELLTRETREDDAPSATAPATTEKKKTGL
jgi:hypothetical protein